MSPPTTLLPTYYSFRLTVAHDLLQDVVKCLDDLPEYLIWPHHGKNGDNAHFHILIPDPPHKLDDRLRKRCCVQFGGKGNGFFAGKFWTNELTEAIHYLKHEDAVPTFKGSRWDQLVQDAPPYVPQEDYKRRLKPVRERLGDPTFTFSNIIKQALKYREANKMKTTNLGEVLEHMSVHTDWVPSKDIIKTGLDHLHFRIFEFRCTRFGKPPNWWQPRIEHV